MDKSKINIRSIRIRIIFIFVIVIAVVCVGFGVMSYQISAKILRGNVQEDLPELAAASAERVQTNLDVHWNALSVLAANDKVIDSNSSWEETSVLLENELKRNGGADIAVVDLEGNTKSPIAESINVVDRSYFKTAVSGSNAVSDPIVSTLDGSLIIVYAVPIKDGDKIVGVLMEIRDGSDLCEYVSTIKKGETGSAFMINKEGTIIAHTDKEKVVKMDNIIKSAQTDATLAPLAEVEKKMIAGESGFGTYRYNNTEKACGYAPVEGTNWSMAITLNSSEALNGLHVLKNAIMIVTVLLILVGAIIAVIFGGVIARPIIEIAEHLKHLAKGDFSVPVATTLLKQKDEIGILANSLDTTQNAIKDIIRGIIKESGMVSELAYSESKQIEELTNRVQEVSKTTETLSAGIEETAASTEEMTANTSEIETASSMIAQKASEGLLTANEISVRANELKDNAIKSQKIAHELYYTTESSLVAAIEQSKAVNEINVLSEAILQITNKTNLLALNAAIEAARAGEAGKGFAVVADEIGNLAESSKNTVNKIQETTGIVLGAVENLSKSATGLLEFMNTKVLKDYEVLVQTGEQYNHDAGVVDSIVSDLSATSQELAASIQNMQTAIHEIAQASSEGAQGATQIATSVSQVTDQSRQVLEGTIHTRESASRMVDIISKIRIE